MIVILNFIFKFNINFSISRTLCGSRLAVGSSNIKICGEVATALAIATFALSPPDKEFVF